MTHIKHVNREKALPDRTRSDPVGAISTDLVDQVLKVIKTEDKDAFKAEFAIRVGYASVQAMDKALRRAVKWGRADYNKALRFVLKKPRRMPAHIAMKFGTMELLSQAMVRRFG